MGGTKFNPKTNDPFSAPIGDRAYDVACPLCEAEPGNNCVYIWPKGVNPFGWRHTKGVQKTIERVGQPTSKPHNERLGVVRDRMIAEWRRSRRLNSLNRPIKRASVEALQIQRAHAQFDLAEYEALREWLRVNGRILINANRTEGSTQ